MPRVRVSARFLRPRSSSSASCTSCLEAAAKAHPFTASSLYPKPPSGKKVVPSALCALSQEKEFPNLLPSFPYNFTVLASYASLQRRPGPIRDVHSDPILELKEGLTVVGHQWLLPSRCLHSSSVVYSKKNTDSERDLHDELELRANSSSLKNPFLVDPTLQDFEEEEEEDTEVFVDREELLSRYNAPAAGDNGRPTTLLYDGDEVEVIATSHSSEEESDLSELDDFAKLHSQPENRDDDHLEAEDSRPEEEQEDVQRTGWESEGTRVEASTECASTLVHLSDFSGMVCPVGQDGSDEHGRLTEGDHHGDHNNGAPYLHTLSVDEVQQILEKARAKDVRILQVRESCEWVDQLVFASGRSSRHLRGMADAIVYKVKQLSENVGPNSYPTVEGRDGEQWMAIDCGNIVVHLFLEEARSYYNLEEFWTKKSNPRLVETY